MTRHSASYSQKYTEIAPLSPEGASASPSSMSVMVDRTGKPVERSDIDHFGFSVRNVYSVQNQFPVITQAERMVDRTVKPVEEMIAEERESSGAQIRTLLNDQRKTIIAECCEKVSHHELQAARAEQERKILQEELWRQQHDFREVHQQNLIHLQTFSRFSSVLNFARIPRPVKYTCSYLKIGRNKLHSSGKISANVFSLLDFEMCLHSQLLNLLIQEVLFR